eukprot:756477-Hanusia_phi.AAC.1
MAQDDDLGLDTQRLRWLWEQQTIVYNVECENGVKFHRDNNSLQLRLPEIGVPYFRMINASKVLRYLNRDNSSKLIVSKRAC